MRPSITYVVNWSNLRGQILPCFKKCFEIYFGCTGGGQDKSLALHNCVNLFRPNAVCFPLVWRETKDLSFFCHLRLINITEIIQIQTHSQISRLATCNEACHIQRRVACTTAFGNFRFLRQQLWLGWRSRTARRGNFHCYPTFEALCSTTEPHLLKQAGLNDLVRDFSLS